MVEMKKKKTDELAFTLRVYRESVQKLDYIATANDRSRNSEINQAIKQYIARYEQENGKITPEDLEMLEE
jgi:predicted transcriptional regulator